MSKIQVDQETLRKALVGICFENMDRPGRPAGNRVECSYIHATADEIENLGWLVQSGVREGASFELIAGQLLALSDRMRSASDLFDAIRTQAEDDSTTGVCEAAE